jgi:TolA-binding protein
MDFKISFHEYTVKARYFSQLPHQFGMLVCLLMLFSASWAQPTGCDEGVIRLPDRSGTIQICSAFAAKVPQLSQQLSDVTKLLGSQQQQIQSLTKLVKGLNGLGQNLSDERQAQMLLNLAREMERSSKRGASTNRRDFETLIDRVDELNGMVVKTSSTPAGAKEVAKSMSQGMGEAISRLEFGSALSQLEEVSAQLKTIGKDVTVIRQDTAALREDIRRMEKQSIEALKAISVEIRSLGNRGGLVDNPKNYAEIYHNARVLAQRGDFDLASQSYEKLFSFPLQMADPIADMVTLARRLYGIKGARSFMDQKLKSKMPMSSYLYAQLLMVDPGREQEFEYKNIANAAQWLAAVRQFPPLAFQLLKMEKPYEADYRSYTWTEWLFFFNLHQVVSETTSNGDFLAFYVDQLRGGTQVDSYSQEKMAPFFEDLFLFALPNQDMPYYSDEADRYSKSNVANKIISELRLVDLEKSPVVIDYTYFSEEPVSLSLQRSAYYFDWRRYPGAPKRENGLIRLSLWDPMIDTKQPIQVCSGTDQNEYCVNLNSIEFKCNRLQGMHSTSERYKCFSVYGNVFSMLFKPLPNADTTFSTREWLKANCISRVNYTDGNGVKVNVTFKNMIATHRWPKGRVGNTELENSIQLCGYQNQSGKIARKGYHPLRGSY